MSQIEEVVTEDIGFAVAGAVQGLRLFDDPIDPGSIAGKYTSLLAVGNARGYLAGSNGSQLILDTLDAIDSATDKKEPIRKVSLPADFSQGISQVAFNASNRSLAVVMGGSLYKLDTDAYFSNKKDSLVLDLIASKDDHIVSIEACPYADDNWLVLYESRALHLLSDHSSTEIAQNVTSYSFDKSAFYYTTSQSLVVYRENNVPVFNAADMNSSWAAEKQCQIIYIKEICPSLAWFAVLESEESAPGSPDLMAFVVDISRGLDSPQYFEADVADPWSDAERFPNYYTAPLAKWLPGKSLFFITTALSSEVGTIQADPDTGALATLVQADDSQRALFPLVDDDDCFPVGMAIDVLLKSATVFDPCPGVSEVTGKLPRVHVLLQLGDLVSWWAFDKKALINETVCLESAAQEYAVTGSETAKLSSGNLDVVSKSQNSFSLSLRDNPFHSNSANENPFGSSNTTPFKTAGDAPPEANSNAPLANVSAPVSSFESTTNDSKAAFGNTGFVTAAFGNPPLATAGFGGSSFGAASFGSSSFGNSSFGQSSFGAIKKALAPSTFQPTSGFGNYAKSTGSSFGGLANAPQNESSPFASLAQSSKADATKAASPFGAMSASSPFASLQKSGETEPAKAASPFGASSASSPFASLQKSGETEPAKAASPFGAMSASSPFASLQKSGETEPAKAASPFGASSTFSGNTQDSSNAATGLNPSPFSQFKQPVRATEAKKENEAAQIKSLPSLSARHSPFGSNAMMGMHNDLSHITEEHDANSQSEVGSTHSGFQNEQSSHGDNDINSDDFENSGDESDSLDMSGTDVSFAAPPLGKLTKSGTLKDLPNAQSSQNVSLNRSSSGSESTPESEPKIESGQSLMNYSTSLMHSPSSPKKQALVTASEEVDYLIHVAPPTARPFLIFDGLIKEDEALEKYDPITLSVREVIQETQAYLHTLSHNTGCIQEQFEFHLKIDPIYLRSKESLLVPDKWRLSHLNDVEELYKQFSEASEEIKGPLRDAAKGAKELVDTIMQSQQDILRINKMFGQLHHHKENVASAVLKRRPLDTQTETMQARVRQKYQRVLDLKKQLRSIMMPIKAKKCLRPESIKDLDRIVFDIDCRARQHQRAIDQMLSELATLELGDEDTLVAQPQEIHLMYPFENRLLFTKTTQRATPIAREIDIQ